MNRTDYEQEMVCLLRRVAHHLYSHSSRMARRSGLTGPQAITLQGLLRSGEMPAGALARKVSLSAGTLSGILDRLEAKGLVERTRSLADRRSVVVRVTPEASRWFNGDLSPLSAEFSSRLAALSDHDRQSILDTLKMLTGMLGETSGGFSNSNGTENRGHNGNPLQTLAAKEN